LGILQSAPARSRRKNAVEKILAHTSRSLQFRGKISFGMAGATQDDVAQFTYGRHPKRSLSLPLATLNLGRAQPELQDRYRHLETVLLSAFTTIQPMISTCTLQH
jgi:hypothetical protein